MNDAPTGQATQALQYAFEKLGVSMRRASAAMRLAADHNSSGPHPMRPRLTHSS